MVAVFCPRPFALVMLRFKVASHRYFFKDFISLGMICISSFPSISINTQIKDDNWIGTPAKRARVQDQDSPDLSNTSGGSGNPTPSTALWKHTQAIAIGSDAAAAVVQ